MSCAHTEYWLCDANYSAGCVAVIAGFVWFHENQGNNKRRVHLAGSCPVRSIRFFHGWLQPVPIGTNTYTHATNAFATLPPPPSPTNKHYIGSTSALIESCAKGGGVCNACAPLVIYSPSCTIFIPFSMRHDRFAEYYDFCPEKNIYVGIFLVVVDVIWLFWRCICGMVNSASAPHRVTPSNVYIYISILCCIHPIYIAVSAGTLATHRCIFAYVCVRIGERVKRGSVMWMFYMSTSVGDSAGSGSSSGTLTLVWYWRLASSCVGLLLSYCNVFQMFGYKGEEVVMHVLNNIFTGCLTVRAPAYLTGRNR